MGEAATESGGEGLPMVVLVAPAAMLFAALFHWPYGYYVLLRLVVSLASAYTAWKLSSVGRGILFWCFIGLAILYNPIVKVPLTRGVWGWVNSVSAIPFLWAALKQRAPRAV
jgi:hypothetical protein